MTERVLVWFKRDLRITDHAPLAAAAEAATAAALYIVEPAWLGSPECDAQHLAFAAGNVRALRETLRARGLPLWIRAGEAVAVLDQIHHTYPFTHLYSHEETGPGWSYDRDRAVARWCRERGVHWRQWPQNGVIRGLRDRSQWAGLWQRRMEAPQAPTPTAFRPAPGIDPGEWPQSVIAAAGHGASRPVPAFGEAAAQAVLQSFLHVRSRNYRRDLSSPLTAETGCSRLSPYLTFGVISMRQVYQATAARIAELVRERDVLAARWARELRAFAARLRWHCHFIQKLETEPAIEFENFSRAYDGLRDPEPDRRLLAAWCEGRTGYPMVDACMRALNATGWLNFRMRAMLVSFAAYHLWLHWREPGLHLARQFLDFEPGIHWSQMQMQSGTTGINTLRMYSPAKQQADHDPHHVFIRQWVPEFGTRDYPPPIVEERHALARAKALLYARRRQPAARAEAAAVLERHGSRQSPSSAFSRARSGQRRPHARAAQATSPRQLTLFDDPE
jgi:deoxyribodipyrimidine photo-lyase